MKKPNVVIHPDYGFLKDAVPALPSEFGEKGTLLHKGRNEIRLMDMGGRKLVVKSYKRLGIIKRLIYRFRSPKARRAYENALKLIESGITTPMPAGYLIVTDSLGLPVRSFYISEYSKSAALEEFFGEADGFNREIIGAFGSFVAMLHRRGILFDDLNSTNVLVSLSANGVPSFSLIDINRMRFVNPEKISMDNRFGNFSRFCYSRPDVFDFFTGAYLESMARHGEIKKAPGVVDIASLKARAINIKRRSDSARRRLWRLKHPFS